MTDPTKKFECNVCHKTFTRIYGLKDHEVVHTGERPFECDVCGTTFRFRKNLWNHHRRIHASRKSKSSRNTPKNLSHKARKSTRGVPDKSRTVSTPKTERKRSKAAISDDYNSQNSEQQREIDSDSVVSSNRGSGNNGNSDEVNDQIESKEEKPEEKPRLMLASPLPKRSKINTPLIKSTPFPIKIEQNIPTVQEVGDLMPFMDLSTSSFPPLAPQQGILDTDLDSEMGSVSNNSSINTPQFSFDEDIRQIAHQLTRVATARPECHDALREVLYGTIVAFGSGGFDKNVGEFFKKMSDRYNR